MELRLADTLRQDNEFIHAFLQNLTDRFRYRPLLAFLISKTEFISLCQIVDLNT